MIDFIFYIITFIYAPFLDELVPNYPQKELIPLLSLSFKAYFIRFHIRLGCERV